MPKFWIQTNSRTLYFQGNNLSLITILITYNYVKIILDQSNFCKSDETLEHWILSRSISEVIQGHFDFPVFSRPRLTTTYTAHHVIFQKYVYGLNKAKITIWKLLEYILNDAWEKYAGACYHFRLELVDIPWGKNTKLARLKIQKDSNLKQFPGIFMKYFLSFTKKINLFDYRFG